MFPFRFRTAPHFLDASVAESLILYIGVYPKPNDLGWIKSTTPNSQKSFALCAVA
jgi:hypothetical protein